MNSIGIPGLIILTALAVGAISLALYAGREAKTSRHVIIQFVFRIVVPFVCVLGLPLVFVGQFFQMDARVWQALIAGVVIAAGWLTSAVFAEIAKSRTKDEKLRDYHKALFAEIRDTLAAFDAGGTIAETTEALIEKMQTDPEFIPFIPRESHDRVYTALLSDIEVLPRQTIDAIVAYYSLIGSIAALADDMRGGSFKDMDQPRRLLMYQDYLAMRERAFSYGEYALALIDAYSEGGASKANAVTKRFNTPAAGQNGHQQGSE